MPFLKVARDYALWLFWWWISSKWSGGGPKHVSYAGAKFAAWSYRARILSWFEGAHNYE